jgi:hypothetical protein
MLTTNSFQIFYKNVDSPSFVPKYLISLMPSYCVKFRYEIYIKNLGSVEGTVTIPTNSRKKKIFLHPPGRASPRESADEDQPA